MAAHNDITDLMMKCTCSPHTDYNIGPVFQYASGQGHSRAGFPHSTYDCCNLTFRQRYIYHFTLEANGPEISLSVNEQALLSFADDRFAYGMFGPVRCGVGRTAYGDVAYQDLR